MGIEEILSRILQGFDVRPITEVLPLSFQCKCSKARFVEALKVLDKDSLLSMANEDGQAEGRCEFCNETYKVSKDLLLDLSNKSGERPTK